MGEYEDVPYIVVERQRGGLVPFLWGALIGAGVALLYAPRTGAALQQELRKGFDRVRQEAGERVGEAREHMADAVERSREKLHDRVASLRESLEHQTAEARRAMEAGRSEARRTRDDLEARMAAARRDAEPGDPGSGSTPETAAGEPEVVVSRVTGEDEGERLD